MCSMWELVNSCGGPDASLFEPIVSHFYSLMQFYLSESGELILSKNKVEE